MTQAATPTPTSAKEMLAYRDQIVKSLRDELDLLKEMQEQGLFDKDKGIITKQNYPEKVSIIEGEIKKLENFDVVLAVVGTMKAGKSTTINAIVGHEIMPNRNRPMTTLPTLIYHTPNQSVPQLTFNNPKVNKFVKDLQKLLQQNPSFRDNQELSTEEMPALINKIIKGWIFEKVYKGEEKIREFLADLNDLVRLSETLRCNYKDHESKLLFPFNECKNIDQLPKIEVAFRYLSDMQENQGRLILLDTPGPNEAGQEHLRTMLTEQLQRSSAVLLVLDYTQLGSKAGQEVKEQLEQVPTIERDRLFALVNKFDQKNANSDNEEQTKQLIFNDFLKNRVELKHIFPLAAQYAFLANRMTTELEINGKPAWDENGWMGDFIKFAYGTMEQEEWDEETIDDIKKKISRLIKKSQVQAPLNMAITKTQLEAPRIAIQAALKQLKTLLEDIENICNSSLRIASMQTDEEIRQLQQAVERLFSYINDLSELQSEVESQLKTVRQREEETAQNKFKNFQKESLKEMKKDIAENFKGKEIINIDCKNTSDELIKSIENIYKKIVDNTIRYIYKIREDSIKIIQLELININNKTYNIINKIVNEFKQENIEIKLTLPDIEEAPIFKTNENIKIEPSRYKDKIYQDKEGVINQIKRFFGEICGTNWGKIEIEKEQYIFNKKNIQELIEKSLKDNCLSHAEQIFGSLFNNMDEVWIENYIDQIYKRTINLIEETEQQLCEISQLKDDREQFHETIDQLQKRNKEIREDIAKVREKLLN